MKQLLIHRHAKSSWKFGGLSDFERPLNDRGKKDAPIMAKHLAKMGVKPDVVISSPAVRAITTALEFAEKTNYPDSKIIIEDKIYEAGLFDLLDLIRNIDDKFDKAVIFGHNPAFTSLANSLSKDFKVDNIPTCGVVALEFSVNSWSDIETGSGKLLFFEYPKKL
jgi:phosphohistidine phosphatase